MFKSSRQAVMLFKSWCPSNKHWLELGNYTAFIWSHIQESLSRFFFFFPHLYSYGLQPPSSCLLCSVIGWFTCYNVFISSNFHKESSFIPSLSSHDFLSPLPPPTKPYNKPPKKHKKENRSILSKVSQHLSYDPPSSTIVFQIVTTTSCHEMCHPL